jgi:hypothetical protein
MLSMRILMRVLLSWFVRVGVIWLSQVRVDGWVDCYIVARLIDLIATIFDVQSTLFNYMEVLPFYFLPPKPLRYSDGILFLLSIFGELTAAVKCINDQKGGIGFLVPECLRSYSRWALFLGEESFWIASFLATVRSLIHLLLGMVFQFVPTYFPQWMNESLDEIGG